MKIKEVKQCIKQVNEDLRTNEPKNVSVDMYSGYAGYSPQHVIDTMNKHFFGQWGFVEIEHDVREVGRAGNNDERDGKSPHLLAVSKVEVWLADIPFRPAAWGQARITMGDVGDAKKAAQTDALKKALSYFSIGNRAYHGLLNVKGK